MRNKSLSRERTLKAVLSIILAVICVIYILPICAVIVNSFKENTYVKSETFALPNENSYVGFDETTISGRR